MSPKKSVDYPFLIVLMFVISIGGYWIVQEIRTQNLNPYLDYLESRLLAVIPQDEDKNKVQTLYDQFKMNVQENKIAPEDVEEVAAGILNLSKDQDSISITLAEDLLASVIPPPRDKGVPEPRLREQNTDRTKWLELNEKFKNIYKFEETLKDKNWKDGLSYQFDKDLQIVIDSREKKNLIEAERQELILTLGGLNKDKILIWTEDLEQKIQHGLDSALIVIEMMQDSIRSTRINAEIQGKDSLHHKRNHESRQSR